MEERCICHLSAAWEITSLCLIWWSILNSCNEQDSYFLLILFPSFISLENTVTSSVNHHDFPVIYFQVGKNKTLNSFILLHRKKCKLRSLIWDRFSGTEPSPDTLNRSDVVLQCAHYVQWQLSWCYLGSWKRRNEKDVLWSTLDMQPCWSEIHPITQVSLYLSLHQSQIETRDKEVHQAL